MVSVMVRAMGVCLDPKVTALLGVEFDGLAFRPDNSHKSRRLVKLNGLRCWARGSRNPWLVLDSFSFARLSSHVLPYWDTLDSQQTRDFAPHLLAHCFVL